MKLGRDVTVRSGIGYDSHRLADGRPLILAGVEIDAGGRGLEGHSDADVVTHAVIDAMLGAAGLGDIGLHFPDDDPRFAGADSIGLLGHACTMLAERALTVAWVDATVICEAPKLGPHRDAMRRRLAAGAGIDIELVNVKFTTNERMGPIGRGEGIAALASVTVEGGR